ncbi:MAG: hypothetical protein LBH98_05315 [Chitinispirillales bacterium]|jgi:hypothetical protein|nr:hypothetical protein [Chitinispirillales bacterium]
MNAIDVPASFQNLENMNRIQQREVTNPLAYAMRNSDEDAKRLENQLHHVHETNSAEKTEVDPDKQRRQQQKNKKKDEEKHKNRGLENGRFVDFTA